MIIVIYHDFKRAQTLTEASLRYKGGNLDTFILDILAHNSGIIKFGKRIWSW